MSETHHNLSNSNMSQFAVSDRQRFHVSGHVWSNAPPARHESCHRLMPDHALGVSSFRPTGSVRRLPQPAAGARTSAHCGIRSRRSRRRQFRSKGRQTPDIPVNAAAADWRRASAWICRSFSSPSNLLFHSTKPRCFPPYSSRACT